MEQYKGKVNKELEQVYDKIIDRFPAGRLAAHMIKNEYPDRLGVMNELKGFTLGNDSDRRYTDEQSKKDAQEFIDMLQILLDKNIQ